MTTDNLAQNISFVTDAIIKDIEDPHPETSEIALALKRTSKMGRLYFSYSLSINLLFGNK